MQINETCLLENTHAIKQIHNLTDNTYILRFERNKIQFKAGQYITIGLEDSDELREYSIYSAEQDDFIEILVKELPDGYLSSILKNLKPEHRLIVNSPMGSMVLDHKEIYTKEFVFIASGTGIAPFHSFIQSNPDIDYTILHGVQYSNEAYGLLDYEPQRHILCTSREENGSYHGRITDYLAQTDIETNKIYYVCGNSQMINEVFGILQNNGVALENIRSEVYY